MKSRHKEIRDYFKLMGVATYKISKDMSERLRKALPSIEDLKKCWMQMKVPNHRNSRRV